MSVAAGVDESDLGVDALDHTRAAIEAHLTIVFTALAIARDLQDRTGWSIRRIIQTLRPLQHVTISIGDQLLQAEPAIPEATAEMLRELGH